MSTMIKAEEVPAGTIVKHAPIDGCGAYTMTLRLHSGQGWYVGLGDALAEGGWPWDFCGFNECEVLCEVPRAEEVEVAGKGRSRLMAWLAARGVGA